MCVSGGVVEAGERQLAPRQRLLEPGGGAGLGTGGGVWGGVQLQVARHARPFCALQVNSFSRQTQPRTHIYLVPPVLLLLLLLLQRVRILGRRRRGATAEDRLRDLDLQVSVVYEDTQGSSPGATAGNTGFVSCCSAAVGPCTHSCGPPAVFRELAFVLR
jgi:hypothetical protein